uniref:Uncharacterized protein n=1 Tax=Anopheles albimanus TaxID=7167 RepID=A0A182F1D6_ANOAL
MIGKRIESSARNRMRPETRLKLQSQNIHLALALGSQMRTMLCSDRQNDANGRPLERKYTVAPELPDHQFSSGVIERRGHDCTAGRHHVVMHRHSPSWRTFGILASFAFPPNPVFHDATITCIWRHAKQKHQPQHGRL